MAGTENSAISDPYTNITSVNVTTTQWEIIRNVVMGFNVLFGPPTHLYVMWFVVMGGKAVSEFLQLNLCVCEVVSSMSSILVFLHKFSQVSLLSKFTIGLLITGRPLFQSLICVERYLAVVHPVTFLKYKSLRYKVICSTAAWIISLGSCVFTALTVASHNKVYMCGLLKQFCFFLLINLFCSLAVLWTLKQPGPGEREREENHKKRNAFNLILLTTVAVLILLVPTIVIGCLYVFLEQDVLNFTGSSFLCLFLAGFVQPVLYLWSRKRPFLCNSCHIKSQK